MKLQLELGGNFPLHTNANFEVKTLPVSEKIKFRVTMNIVGRFTSKNLARLSNWFGFIM